MIFTAIYITCVTKVGVQTSCTFDNLDNWGKDKKKERNDSYLKMACDKQTFTSVKTFDKLSSHS